MWLGPRRTVTVKSELVYEVEDILYGKREVVHTRQLPLYHADMDGKYVGKRLHRAVEHAETVYQYACSIRLDRAWPSLIRISWDIRIRDGQIQILI